MKSTEIGMIPDDWEVKEIKEFADVTTGNKNTQDAQENGKYPFYVRSPIVERINTFSFDSEGLVTAGDGVGTGKVFHFVKGKFGLHQRAYLVHKFQNVDSKYFYYIFSQNFYERVHSMTAKSSVDSVRREMITQMSIPLPPTLAEQQKIAKSLSDVDNVISTLEKLIAKKKNLKQGTMQQLLTGKKRLPGFAKSDKFKQTEIGEIPEDWDVVNIQEVLVSSKDKLKIGPFGSQLKKEYLLETGLYKVFGQENIYSNNFDYCYRFLTREHFQNLQSCELNEGDFVISTMGTIGKCAVVPENAGIGIMDSHLVRLRLNQNIDKDYFKYYFQSNIIQNQIKALSVGGIMDGLSTSIIKKLDVIKFSKPEQTAIAIVLSSMDKEIEALEAKLGKYRNLKTGMMQQLLTGKVRLV